jgi:hypothetical protein
MTLCVESAVKHGSLQLWMDWRSSPLSPRCGGFYF